MENYLSANEQVEFQRHQILKGVEKRLSSGRVSLFDLFYVNSGSLENELPSICASYVFLDPEGIKKFIGITAPKEITEKELNETKEMASVFASENKYWEYVIVIIDARLRNNKEDLVECIISDIMDFNNKSYDGDNVSIAEREKRCEAIQNLLKTDLGDYQEFYRQLYNKFRFLLAISWFDNFHKLLLKKYLSILPHRDLVEAPAGDLSFFTKTQKRFRERILQQENGDTLLNKLAKRYFDTKYMIKIESGIQRLMPSNDIEGLQYWGDEERIFDDKIELDYDQMIKKGVGNVVPGYDAIVYMGHDWNAFNRTKYNLDNLPDLTVRGYRFRIFYPDLKDKNTAPKYTLQPNLVKLCKNKADEHYSYTAIRFDAGPPYLPIAFRIVDKKWDEYRNGGFVSNFHNSVFTFQIAFRASLYYKGYTPEQLY